MITQTAKKFPAAEPEKNTYTRTIFINLVGN
jgi:hypothetical protein